MRSFTLLFITIFSLFCFGACNQKDDTSNNGFNNSQNNQNNIVNECDPDGDEDNDTISNGHEGCMYLTDTDGDTIPDYLDTDSDNDGIRDAIEAGDTDLLTPPRDFDGDGDPDYRDTDSDNDGVEDGFEDRNFDGKLGTCEKTCVYGSELEGETCGPGQYCLGNGSCSPAVSFDCAMGETDPLNTDTDGDGVPDGDEGTFVCNPASETNPYGRKDVRFVQMDFIKVGLETEAVATNLVISDATGHEDALTHDLESTAAEVAGFTLTMDLDESIADHESIDANFVAIKSHIVSALGGENAVIMRASGSKTLSHEEYPTYVNAIFDVSTSGVNAIELRNQLIGAIMRRSLSNFTGLPDTGQLWSPTGSNFVISLSVQKAEPKKWNGTEWVISDQYLVIQGGVTSLSNYTNPSYTSIMNLDDLSNSTGYAGFSASEETECEPYSVGTVPVADIIWVIDESGSMYDKQSSVASNAVDFFNRAIAYGLDFRMGVVGVGEDQVKLCTGQNESADYFLTPSDLNRFQQCVMEPNGEYPAEGGSEYGITTGYNAIMNHLPRVAANPGKIRPNAQLVVIYVSDERAEELKEFCGGSESSGMDNIDPTCMWSQIGPTIQQLNGETGTGGIGKAHAIIGPPPNGCDSAVQVGQGYLDIVQYLGGQVGSVCQTNLGPTLQVIIEDIVASSSPVRLAHVPISLSIAGAKDGIALERSRSNGFDYRASANAIVFIGQTFDPNHPSEILISYWRWVTDVVPVD